MSKPQKCWRAHKLSHPFPKPDPSKHTLPVSTRLEQIPSVALLGWDSQFSPVDSGSRAGVQRGVPGSPPESERPPQATTPQELLPPGPTALGLRVLALSFFFAFLAFRAKNHKMTLGGLHLGLCSWPFKMQGESLHVGASTKLRFYVFNQDPAPSVDKAFQTFAESMHCKSPIPVTEPLEHTGWSDVGTAFDLEALVMGHKGAWSSGPAWEGNGFRQLSRRRKVY